MTTESETTGTADIGEPYCYKCRKTLIYVGDVPEGGFPKGFEPYCTCGSDVEPTGLIGWICPICGCGLSPYTSVCPCMQKPFDIICKSNNL